MGKDRVRGSKYRLQSSKMESLVTTNGMWNMECFNILHCVFGIYLGLPEVSL